MKYAISEKAHPSIIYTL